MTRWAQDMLAGRPEPQLECRWLKHRFTREGIYRTSEGIVVKFQCGGCTAGRIDVLKANFTLKRRIYQYPEGYLMQYTEDDRARGRRLRQRDVIEAVIKSNTKRITNADFEELVAQE